MTLVELLKARAETMVAGALEQVRSTHLKHYEAVGAEETAERLRALMNLLIEGVEHRQLAAVEQYAESLATARHASGAQLIEVLTVINLLEEQLWTVILGETAPEAIGESLGLASTVLGHAKDHLACAWVKLVTHHAMGSLDVGNLFRGTQGIT